MRGADVVMAERLCHVMADDIMLLIKDIEFGRREHILEAIDCHEAR